MVVTGRWYVMLPQMETLTKHYDNILLCTLPSSFLGYDLFFLSYSLDSSKGDLIYLDNLYSAVTQLQAISEVIVSP